MGRSSVLLIYTGGTIGMKTDPVTGTLVPFDFNGIYDEFPSLRRLDVDLEVLPFEPIDSSNVAPELWVRLADIIRENYERYDGFVVLHGTDTMSYTAAALSYLIQDSPKPIVLTGSQKPMGNPFTDAKLNLYQSLLYALDEHSHDVSIVFGGVAIAGTRARKSALEISKLMKEFRKVSVDAAK